MGTPFGPNWRDMMFLGKESMSDLSIPQLVADCGVTLLMLRGHDGGWASASHGWLTKFFAACDAAGVRVVIHGYAPDAAQRERLIRVLLWFPETVIGVYLDGLDRWKGNRCGLLDWYRGAVWRGVPEIAVFMSSWAGDDHGKLQTRGGQTDQLAHEHTWAEWLEIGPLMPGRTINGARDVVPEYGWAAPENRPADMSLSDAVIDVLAHGLKHHCPTTIKVTKTDLEILAADPQIRAAYDAAALSRARWLSDVDDPFAAIWGSA